MSELKTTLLRGRMSNRDNQRLTRDFVLTQSKKVGVGASAIAAGIAGLGGNAIGLVGTMGNSEESADYVTFELDGKRIAGWLWKFPFNNGDELEVVAEQVDDGYNALSVRRPEDGLVAVFPHCTRGRMAHFRKSFKYWFYSSTFTIIAFSIMLYLRGFFDIGLSAYVILLSMIMLYAVYLILSIPLALRYMKFVRLSEACFQTYGWPNVENIDLYVTSKAMKRKGDPADYGQVIYRY